MFLTSLKSKIHCATITEANLNYMGSITIDEDLLEAAGIYANEKVQVVNNNNGSRLETYVIKGARKSGVICLNGAAARMAQPGDKVIIITYAMMAEEEFHRFTPTVVMVDENNRITEIRDKEVHGSVG